MNGAPNYPELIKKWQKVLDSKDAPPLKTNTQKGHVALLLENTYNDILTSRSDGMQFTAEDTPTNVTGGVAKWDPVLIGMVRRAIPQLMSNDLVGVQPMNMPTGLAFALRARYTDQSGQEALGAPGPEPRTAFTGIGSGVAGAEATTDNEPNPFARTSSDPLGTDYTTGRAMPTADAEGDIDAEMALTIDKIPVQAKSRQLKASWSIEMAQDLRAVHGLDAETEFSNILQEELIQEMNREITRTLYRIAKLGGPSNAGTFDIAQSGDTDGRWLVERFKGLMFQIEKEANSIFFQTRRGRGNFIIATADVASALGEAGYLDYAGTLANQGRQFDVDPSSATYLGVLNGKYRLYVDPWVTSAQYVVVGYKGPQLGDQGVFYCPYVPVQLLRATDPESFQPRIAFKTRYGLVQNPFVQNPNNDAPAGETFYLNNNSFYRKVRIDNL